MGYDIKRTPLCGHVYCIRGSYYYCDMCSYYETRVIPEKELSVRKRVLDEEWRPFIEVLEERLK